MGNWWKEEFYKICGDNVNLKWFCESLYMSTWQNLTIFSGTVDFWEKIK